MKTRIVGLIALGLGLSALAGPAAAGPLPVATFEPVSGDIVQVYHRGRPHYRRYAPRVRVYPRYREPVPYFADYSNYYPAVRGFEDYNPVPRGNMRGCTVDLGYGRYESCDKN